MPELPDIVVYIEALRRRVVGQPLERIRLRSPFLLRSVTPPIEAAEGLRVQGLRRAGKRIVFELEDDLFLVLHLMIAGRLRWGRAGAKPPGKVTAFHEGMSVHGRYGEPCPDCAAPVQRIRYASNESHYCARCQTGGKLLADRGLSHLLKSDWPRTLEELEERTRDSKEPG